MSTSRLWFGLSVVVGMSAILDARDVQAQAELDSATQKCQVDPRVTAGLVRMDVCVGAELFFRATFDGNGRSCATCHPVANNFTIDPRFIATLPASDPLFVAEQRADLGSLERPDFMRRFGLILENVDGLDDPDDKFVLRSVPHTLGLAASIAAPDDGRSAPERTGWSGDGSPDGTLRGFQNGAIVQHYPNGLGRRAGIDFRLASAAELDALEAYMLSVGRTADIDLATMQLADTQADAGRQLFMRLPCNTCHANAGANLVGLETNDNFDTDVDLLRLPGTPADGGFGTTGGDLASGMGDGTFNTTPLVEAADTAPFFHTNHAASLEEAIAFYATDTLGNSPAAAALGIGPAPIGAVEITQLSRFLRGLNVALNARMAQARIEAALKLMQSNARSSTSVQAELLRLASVEIVDAIEVLRGAPGRSMSPAARGELTAAAALLEIAAKQDSVIARRALSLTALRTCERALRRVGTGLEYPIGDGTLMF